MKVYVIRAECGDYYCGCGLGHLVGIALTAVGAELLRAEGEAATYRFKSHGEHGRDYRSYEDVTVEEVPVGLLLNESIR